MQSAESFCRRKLQRFGLGGFLQHPHGLNTVWIFSYYGFEEEINGYWSSNTTWLKSPSRASVQILAETSLSLNHSLR